MRILSKIKPAGTLLLVASLLGGLTACGVEEKTLNTDTVEYVPEEKPIGIIIQKGLEYEPGSLVELKGRIYGTTNGQTILWSQKSGTPIEGIEVWDQPTLSFIAPNVVGIEVFVFEFSVLESDGTVAIDEDGNPLIGETKATVFDPATKLFYEIEDPTYAELIGVEAVTVGNEAYLPGASGDYHTADIVPDSSVKFTINSEEEKFVTLYTAFASPYGEKAAEVEVNGVVYEIKIPTSSSFSDYRVETIKLNVGDNIIEVGAGWGYYRVDYIMTVPAAKPAGPLPVTPKLVNSNASQEALDLMELLSSHYGSATISGQQEFPHERENSFPLLEFNKIVAATGDDAPAIVGFDYINLVNSSGSAEGYTESIIREHNEKGIIATASWHWFVPDGAEGQTFRASETDFDLAAVLSDKTSDDYLALMNDIDTLAAELQKLEDAKVPLLFRPLHEGEQQYFWWAKSGPEALKELWVIMYNRMTIDHGLDNLIWVFTHTSSLSEDWYPGDAYVDIVGFDGYANPANDSNATFTGQYATLKERHDGKKLVALTETGAIPNVSTMHEQNAWWAFYVTWNSETWNPESIIGPQGAEPTVIDANYAGEAVINLDDIGGNASGLSKIEAGVYEGFDISVNGFEGQINGVTQPGIKVTNNWATSGVNALTYIKNLSASSANDVILQVHPAGGIDVSDISKLSVSANVVNAGASITVKLWAKDTGGVWRHTGASTLVAEGIELSIDVSDIDTVSGFGLQIESLDATATAAEFYLDNVRLDGSTLYDFEPDTSNFGAQINWVTESGITVTNDWATSGVRALSYIKNLSLEDAPTGVILQAYPEGGVDVSDVNLLKVSAQAVNVGSATTIKLWAKDGSGIWRDTGATPINTNALELAIDVSDIDTVNGFGLQIENFDASATDARFYLDNVRLDDSVLYDFEGTDGWEFQVNWNPVQGIQLAKDWTINGSYSLAGVTQLIDNDDNIILQVYPEGGLVLGDVTTLKITANVKDAGDAVKVQLFGKDKDGKWMDSGAVSMVDGGVELSLNVADLTEMSAFGVVFMKANNADTSAKFYIDNVKFE